MARQTMENYTRDFGSTIHTSFRHDIEFQEEEQTHSWSVHTRGKWKVLPYEEEVLKQLLVLQRARPDRTYRLITRVETETRSEPYHPEFLRQMAESSTNPTEGA